jgi:hypothetical protein
LKHIQALHKRGLTTRKILAQLSLVNVSVARSTIENALRRLSRLPTTPAAGIAEFLRKCPGQEFCLLDIFPWRGPSRVGKEWIVRECISGEVLTVIPKIAENELAEILRGLPSVPLGVLAPEQSHIPALVRRCVPGLSQIPIQVPMPKALSEQHANLCEMFGLPICYLEIS